MSGNGGPPDWIGYKAMDPPARPARQTSPYVDKLLERKGAEVLEAVKQAEIARGQQIRQAAADREALWHLANTSMPADVREYAERHKLPTFGEALWINAYMAGWRAAVEALQGKVA